MGIGRLTPQQIATGAPQRSKVVRYTAPIKGIDTRVSISLNDPYHCLYTYNLIPYDYGLRVRQGYREIAVGLEDVNSVGVHTIIPFEGVIEDGAQDRLFAVTNEGIWDVTTPAVVLKTTFANQAPEAGYGVYTHYVDGAGDDILYYADSRNGLYEYDPVGDTWAQATNIDGPVIGDINFIVSHKQRLWMCEERSQKAWYLPVGSNSGVATEFFFASKFKHGGALVGLYNWSIDGGDGIDDYLVAVSRSGDVLPFRGDDPSSSVTWSLVGTYFIGKIPAGPNFATEHGGELFLLSSYGIVSMNDLLKGVSTPYSFTDDSSQNVASKISGWLRDRLLRTIDQVGWSIRVAPSDGSLIINSVNEPGREQLQFVYNIATSAWGQWRDVPMSSFDSYDGFIAFGDKDNRVLFMDVNTDNVQITPPLDRLNGDGVRFSVLTGYQGLEMNGVYKRVKLIRPDFVAKGQIPAFRCQARYDYDLTEITPPISQIDSSGEWDSSTWDMALWGDDSFKGSSGLVGSWGYGRYVAIAMSGESRTDTRFVGWDVMFDAGGALI